MNIRTLSQDMIASFSARVRRLFALVNLRKPAQPATGVLVGEALREHWLKRLPKGERQVFQILCLAWPKTLTREALYKQTGYKRPLLDIYILRLAQRNLVESALSDDVKAADRLFKQ